MVKSIYLQCQTVLEVLWKKVKQGMQKGRRNGEGMLFYLSCPRESLAEAMKVEQKRKGKGNKPYDFLRGNHFNREQKL